MHAYPGGALRIHMLRHKLGDTVFWNAVKDYVNTFQGQNVETADFQKCLEKASGINLVKFFDQVSQSMKLTFLVDLWSWLSEN